MISPAGRGRKGAELWLLEQHLSQEGIQPNSRQEELWDGAGGAKEDEHGAQALCAEGISQEGG